MCVGVSAILRSLTSAGPWPLAEPLSTPQAMCQHREPPGSHLSTGEQTQPPRAPPTLGGLCIPWKGVLALLALSGWEQEPVSCPDRDFLLEKGPAQSLQRSPGEEELGNLQPAPR